MSNCHLANSSDQSDIKSVFVEGANLQTDKLENLEAIVKLINDTIEKQTAILELNQMNQDDLRTVVQL